MSGGAGPRTVVKVCGLTGAADARACRRAGADWLGIVLADSPRRVVLAGAARIRAAVPDATLVGVFVDPEPQEVAAAVAAAGLDLVQLHGDESPELCREIGAAAGRPVIKAFAAAAPPAPGEVARHAAAAHLLFDLPRPRPADPLAATAAVRTAAAAAAGAGLSVLLAGGLDPDNVREAVARVRPFGVDVSRGVERSPGVKDPRAVARFVEEVRRAHP